MLKQLGLMVFAVSFMAMTASEARAQAMVVKGAACRISGVDAGGNLQNNLGADGSAHIVRNGNVTVVVCKANVTNQLGKAVNRSGIPCMVPHPDPDNNTQVPTTDTKLTISASGVATMRCKVKASDL